MATKSQDNFSFTELINLKKAKKELSKDQLKWLITSFVNGEIEDYQMSAMAMAILLNGMSDQEIVNLTIIMMNSGDTIDLSEIKGIKVDKHSTGGVGDKTSLALTPICAAAGAPIAKMSGRGLGITGGTLDKLESIEGFNISLTEKQFIKQVKEIGCAIIGQTGNLVPADKKLYALRDVTGTVDSKALVISSIMSKKLATGADAISLDVKCGDGSFSKTFEIAKELAKGLVKVGKKMNRDVVAHITNMQEPLGKAIGNAVEVIEAVETLKGKGPKDFNELVIKSSAGLLVQAKIVKNVKQGIKLSEEMIKSGKALAKFKEMIKAQGGNPAFIDNYDQIWNPKKEVTIKAQSSGYVKWISAQKVGEASVELGAGRIKKTDNLDYHAGIYILKQSGEKVNKGEVVAKLFTSIIDIPNSAVEKVNSSFEIIDTPKFKKMILGEVK